MPCTTILVGKNASYDGSTLMARNEDSGPGHFTPKKFTVINPENQPKHYKSVISGVEIELPDNPLRYTSMPNSNPKSGIWGEAGVNELNIAMSETETITSNSRVLGADPLVKEGIGEEDLLTIVLPYIKSAREGVVRLGSLLEQYGTYEMNGIGFQDVDEIWWFESVGGHHWIAKRVPDDSYAVIPNQQGIDWFDFTDAFGDKKEYMCSADMIEFVKNNYLNADASEPENDTMFDARRAFGSHTEQDHCYNTPRAWVMERYLNPNGYVWDGPDADYGPESDDIPWCMVPEKKITVEDVKYVLSSYYQGTQYDPYGHRGDNSLRGKYRPVGINRNNFVAITQLRPYAPEDIMAVEWIAEASNAFNIAVPFYANITKAPEYLENTTDTVSTDNFYWASRLIGALADANFGKCIQIIERYQLKAFSAGHRFIAETDAEFAKQKPVDIHAFLEERNDIMAADAKSVTDSTLSKVLIIANDNMKNAFSRADS